MSSTPSSRATSVESLKDGNHSELKSLDERSKPSHTMGAKQLDTDDLSDNDSVLSDVDEAQFEDFDPEKIAIDERPVDIDEDNIKLIGRHKRKRDNENTDVEGIKRKKREGKREKRSRKKRNDGDDVPSGAEEMEGRKARKKKTTGEGSERREKARPRAATPVDEELLDPETRRRLALDRAMDLALKNPNKRRRRNDGIDLSNQLDEEIASLRERMADAAQKDTEARSAKPPRPATHKLKMLDEVRNLLNRNGREVENAIVDPENNLLEAVRFFLEPLYDGSLPAYDIQRDLFAALVRLPIAKDSLIASGIGKIVLFYTKSKKPELAIKRTAERLLAEWTRPILKRSDDYRNRVLETMDYDPNTVSRRPGTHSSQGLSEAELAAIARAKALAPPPRNNRARLETDVKTYTIAPRSSGVALPGAMSKSMGASGDAAFRRMKMRQQQAQGKGPRRG